jgi:hypothetical protein
MNSEADTGKPAEAGWGRGTSVGMKNADCLHGRIGRKNRNCLNGRIGVDISKAVLLIGLWFVTVYFAAEVWLPTLWAINCGFANAVLGVLVLFLITRTEKGARLFYEGPGVDEEGWIVIALAWCVPGIIFFLGLLWWGLRFVFQLLGWWRL